MHAPSKCPICGFEAGDYAETYCPRCGASFAPKPPLTLGIYLLDVVLAICGTLFVFASMAVFALYMNSSTRAELYQGAPYHETTFRVISVQYSPPTSGVDGASIGPSASAVGIVEGQRESMDLLPYIYPHDRYELMEHFPEGTVIPVYLFPTLRGASRIQRVGVSPAEKYQREETWTKHRVLPAAGAIGFLTTLLGLARFSLSRSRRVEN